MAINPYFLYPWASDPSATISTINPTGGSTGPLSYQWGYTGNYELDLNTDPSALPIPRPEFNQLMLDITSALQQLQTQGFPLWVSSAGGGPASYPIYAIVFYLGLLWQSQISSNTSTPGTDTNWAQFNNGLAPGSYIDSASPNGYPGALLCDGTQYLRSGYPQLFNALTIVFSCVTIMSNPQITVPSTANLSAGTLFAVEGSNIPAGAYIISIDSTTKLTLSAAPSSSGTFNLTFFLYGNYDTSGNYFQVPDCRRTVNVAAGGSGNSVLSNKIANTGGDDTYMMQVTDLVNHTHAPSLTGWQYIEYKLTSGSTSLGFGGAMSWQTYNNTGYVTGFTSQTGMNIIQQSQTVFRYIKF